MTRRKRQPERPRAAHGRAGAVRPPAPSGGASAIPRRTMANVDRTRAPATPPTFTAEPAGQAMAGAAIAAASVDRAEAAVVSKERPAMTTEAEQGPRDTMGAMTAAASAAPREAPAARPGRAEAARPVSV